MGKSAMYHLNCFSMGVGISRGEQVESHAVFNLYYYTMVFKLLLSLE